MKSLAILGVLALAIVADADVSMNNPFFCYMTDPIRSITNMHATETSYEAIRRFNFTSVNPYVTNCTPSRFWYLGRNGARFPHPGLLQNMLNFANSSIQAGIISNYAAGRTTLCRQDFEAIRDWTIPEDFNLANASRTIDSGVIAMENIARRYQEHFPDILTETYSRDRFHFRHTGTERTERSIRAFATGLFGDDDDVVFEDVPVQDWFLRPFDFCPAFWEEIANWPLQQNAFYEGPEFLQMMDEINERLGFHGINPLSINDVIIMWQWCRYETGAKFETSNSERGGDSAWCAGFSVAHNLLLEYSADLGHFYFTGYGVRNQRLLENLNCGLLQDLLRHMQSDNENDQLARVFLTYNQEIQMMLVALGSFRDLWPLHQHNVAQQSDRHWLTSLIAQLSSNIVVVRYDCDDGDHDLVFLLNERPILVPGCDQQTGVCKLSVIVNRFQRFLNVNCAFFFCSTN